MSHPGRKDNKGDDEEVEWRAIYTVPLMSNLREEPAELPTSRLCFSMRDTAHASFFVGGNDGQLVLAMLVPTPEVTARPTAAQPRHVTVRPALLIRLCGQCCSLVAGHWQACPRHTVPARLPC